MKGAILTLAAGLTALALAAPNGVAGSSSRDARAGRHHALLTIPALGIYGKAVRPENERNMALGPVWNPSFPARPGKGQAMLVEAHDVTPVPGYGAHGPFYNLDLIKRGDLAKVRWNRVWRTYRFVRRPVPHPQSAGNGYITTYSRKHPGQEVIFFRCCWPRGTSNDWMTARAVLVRPKRRA